MTNSLFGGKPKKPELEQVKPIEKVLQTNIADDTVRRDLAKRRRATQLNQVTGEANIKRQTLGAG